MKSQSASLFGSARPGVFESAVGWIEQVLLGELAVGLCVIAIALLGIMMLAGRLPLRNGARIILGCFTLLGAPVIAADLAQAWRDDEPTSSEPIIVQSDLGAREELPPADYNPYARATMRRD